VIDIFWQILFVIFILKLLWNALTPVAAARAYSRWKREGGQKPGAISMAPVVELIVLVVLIGISALAQHSGLGFGPGETLMYGLIAIALSYAIATGIGAVIRKSL
jgi:hypothetical protein